MTILLTHQIETSVDGLPVFLAAEVAADLPVERVQTVPADGGWQVLVVRMDGEELLPVTYPDLYDAEWKAAQIAIQCDITLVCDDDPDGHWADDWTNRLIHSAEEYDKATRWMY